MKSNFRTVFFTLVSIAFLSGGTSVYLATHPTPNEQQITVDPLIHHGSPVITGTRVPNRHYHRLPQHYEPRGSHVRIRRHSTPDRNSAVVRLVKARMR